MKDLSQSKFIASSAKNPCPICDRTKDGDCRIKDTLVICHTHQEAIEIPGWRYVGYSSGGAGGGKFVRDDGTPPRQTRKKIKHPNERAGERLAKAVAQSNPNFFKPEYDPVAAQLSKGTKDTPTLEPEETLAEETFYQRVEAVLYAHDPWITLDNMLYRWVGTHYQACPDEGEAARIKVLASTIVETRRNKPTYTYASPDHIQKALKWVKYGFGVTAAQVNPSGINCTNGVLELRWEGTKLITDLVKHDPSKHFYLSPPVVTYNPNADPAEYERLMQCLDPAPRQIWERTIAASLDLDTVRKHKGRAVRAALLKGDGSNGKDALRTIAQMLMGNGAMSACTVTDFKDYDSGRKFPLFELRGKRLNWPSENADAGRIDQFRALRAAITGDPITFEQKNRPALPSEPLKTVFLFNVNEAPNLVAQLQATASRWTLIPFTKTFTSNPTADQLKADPRFKEDPQFVQQKILPAFLNQMLEQLQAVVIHGIDYSCTQHLFDEMQRESSHLLQFAHDTGLQYDPEGSVTVKELWDSLRTWYEETGTLVIEESVTAKGAHKEKLTWNEQPRHGDRNVKGANQVAQRFLEIFPKAKKGARREPGANNSETILTGIKFTKTDQRDQRDQCSPDVATVPEKQLTNELTNGDSQLTNGGGLPLEARYPVSTQLVPSSKTDQKPEPLRNGHSVGHVGHGTQFLDKEFVADNIVRYVGTDSRIRRLPGIDHLVVEAIDGDRLMVKNPSWAISHKVKPQDLELIKESAA